jgi:hypothetical protein
MYDAFTYGSKGGIISSISPGVIFYYNTVTAPSDGTFTVKVTQMNDLAWNSMLLHEEGNNPQVYDANCNPVGATNLLVSGTTSPYVVQFDVTGATEGATYYIGIKYSPANLVGQQSGSNTYYFSTAINDIDQTGSEASIPVNQK